MIKPRYNAAGRPWVDRPQYGKLRNRPRGRRSRKPRREPRDARGGGPSLCFQASCLFPRVQIASLQANLPFDYLYLAKSRIKRVSEGEEEVWKVMEMLVFPRWGWDFSFVADFRENINVNEIIANSDQNLNMRTLNFLSLCITFFFFKFCRSCFTILFTLLYSCPHRKYTRWNKETEAESRLPSFKNYLHTVVDASSLPLVNSSSSFGGVERANPANKWEVWNSRQKNTSSRKRKSRGMDKV